MPKNARTASLPKEIPEYQRQASAYRTSYGEADPGNVTQKVMRDALQAISKKMPQLGLYLQKTCTKVGHDAWQYVPVEEIKWEFLTYAASLWEI